MSLSQVRNAAGVITRLPGPSQVVTVAWPDGLLGNPTRVGEVASDIATQAGVLATTGKAPSALGLIQGGGTLLTSAAAERALDGGARDDAAARDARTQVSSAAVEPTSSHSA